MSHQPHGDLFVNPIYLGAAVLWHEIGAEDNIPNRKEHRVVAAVGISFVAVVPVVEFGSDDDSVQWAEPPANVGVEEQANQHLNHSDGS